MFASVKNIYEQYAQLATAKGATETKILRMLIFLAFAVCSLHKFKMHYGKKKKSSSFPSWLLRLFGTHLSKASA